MPSPKLKDLVTMLDFFDPELPVVVFTEDDEPIRIVMKVAKTPDEATVVLYTQPWRSEDAGGHDATSTSSTDTGSTGS